MKRNLGLLLVLLGIAVGCAHQTTQNEPFTTRLYKGTYDDIWLATLKALNDYPLKLSNKDSGKIHTELVNGPYNELLFAHPEPIQLPERFRFSLKFNFGRLEADNDQNLVRIRVVKELEKFQDFYTGWVPYPTDSLEERLLLYRIEHILAMDRHMGAPH